MVSVAIYLTAPITSVIEADDLRSEVRWERNMLSVLLQNNRLTQTNVGVDRLMSII